jgi:hypothetical protein
MNAKSRFFKIVIIAVVMAFIIINKFISMIMIIIIVIIALPPPPYCPTLTSMYLLSLYWHTALLLGCPSAVCAKQYLRREHLRRNSGDDARMLPHV